MKLALLGLAMASVSTGALAQTYQRTDTGIVVTPASRPQAAVRLQVFGDEIIRVSSTPTKDLNLPQSLMVVAKPMSGNFSLTATTPASRSAGLRASSLFATPRGLKEPDRWSSSSLSVTGTPSDAVIPGLAMVGVRIT